MQRIVKIPTKNGITEISAADLLELIHTSSLQECYNQLGIKDNWKFSIVLEKEFGDRFSELKSKYIQQQSNLEEIIIESKKVEDVAKKFKTTPIILDAALKAKYNLSYLEIKVRGKLRRLGVNTPDDLKNLILKSDSLLSLANQIQESHGNLNIYIMKYINTSYYEIKYQKLSDAELVDKIRQQYEEKGYDSLPRPYLIGRLGKNWFTTINNVKRPNTASSFTQPELKRPRLTHNENTHCRDNNEDSFYLKPFSPFLFRLPDVTTEVEDDVEFNIEKYKHDPVWEDILKSTP